MNIKDQLNAIYSDQYKSYIETDSLILGQYAALSLPDLSNNLKQINAIDIAYDLVPVYFKKTTLKYNLLEKSILAGEILKFGRAQYEYAKFYEGIKDCPKNR